MSNPSLWKLSLVCFILHRSICSRLRSFAWHGCFYQTQSLLSPASTYTRIIQYAPKPVADPFGPTCSHAPTIDMSHDMMDNTPMTSDQCLAGDAAYLTSLAWCLSTKCPQDDVPAWKLEVWCASWASNNINVSPKWSYARRHYSMLLNHRHAF